ncbi:uncharacterized protein LOC133903230 [Phragmites australis]|uniref:uncharacterized protein LOC133903230 n=1 Tax=Phragmites australis TaxID=29695 RepID=UPI002D78CAE2|nr:uncharacterized protein LOC133903230 [Phragmites australis]
MADPATAELLEPALDKRHRNFLSAEHQTDYGPMSGFAIGRPVVDRSPYPEEWYGEPEEDAPTMASIWCRHWTAEARHGEPSLLSVFMDYSGHPIFHSILDPPDAIADRRFLLWHNVGGYWDLLGVRHGRALVFNRTRHQFIVWDPATGDRRCVPVAPGFDDKEKIVFNGAVLCASGDQGHVHGECHSSPFQVVLIDTSSEKRQAFACIYSSETGVWGDLISTAIRYIDTISSPSTLIGSSFYWLIDDIDEGILEFDLDRHSLAVIEPPDMDTPSGYNYHIIIAEDGGVGLAVTVDFSLDMWDRKVNCDGIGTWVLRKTVKLEEITGLSRNERGHMIIHGYDEDDNVIFLRTDNGCFVVQLESMQFRNLGKRDFITTCAYHPSFYSCRGSFLSLIGILKKKIFGITLGNSAANDTMVDMLKHNLVHKKVLPVEAKLLHNGLKFVDPILGKIRECQEMVMMAVEDNDPFTDWYQHLSNNILVSTELDRYLNESPIQQSEYFDILKWWMVYAPMYPTLASIVRDVLAMPMSAVASKSAFSTKGRTISDYHKRLTTDTTEVLIRA